VASTVAKNRPMLAMLSPRRMEGAASPRPVMPSASVSSTNMTSREPVPGEPAIFQGLAKRSCADQNFNFMAGRRRRRFRVVQAGAFVEFAVRGGRGQ